MYMLAMQIYDIPALSQVIAPRCWVLEPIKKGQTAGRHNIKPTGLEKDTRHHSLCLNESSKRNLRGRGSISPHTGLLKA